MENVTIKDIVEATGGVLLCGDENKVIRGFSIDSREGSEDSIFVPIIGERVDAHRFIESALALNGATFTSEHRPGGPQSDGNCLDGVSGAAHCPNETGVGADDKTAKEKHPWEEIAGKTGVVKPWIKHAGVIQHNFTNQEDLNLKILDQEIQAFFRHSCGFICW